VRTPAAKYVHRHPDGPFELYDLAADPFEKMNLFGQPRYAALQTSLAAELREFFEKYADARYDLYRGGTSKARLLSNPQIGPARPR
jgi:arylsulfatase A-like enzyme